MFKTANSKTKRFYQLAAAAKKSAFRTRDPVAREGFFASEQRWLQLAASYDLDHFMDQAPDSPKSPICRSCSATMCVLEIHIIRSPIEYMFGCKTCKAQV